VNGTVIAKSHPRDDLLRADRFPHILCPACGIGTVIHCYVDAIARSGKAPEQHACVSGIGCSGRAAGYVAVDSYHATHGRAIPFAIGIAVARPELTVTVISGDGDLAAIGGNHLIHAARRNIDLRVICINNFNYGMTGGQAGPTSPREARTTTTPHGVHDRPFNLPHLMAAAGAAFVARWTILHVHPLQDALMRIMDRRGFSFVEVLSPCPTNFGKMNAIDGGLGELEAYRRRCRIVDDVSDFDALDVDIVDGASEIAVGNFVDRDRTPWVGVGEAGGA